MRRPLLALVAALTGVVVLAAPAGAVIGGSPDGDRHPYVGLVTDLRAACSGSLVAPRVFITAAHCFKASGQTVRVSVRSNPRRDGRLVTGRWYPHPQFCLGCGSFARNDLAVVVLDEPIVVKRYAELPEPGTLAGLSSSPRVTLVGYGVSGWSDGSTMTPKGAGSRRTAVSRLQPAAFGSPSGFVQVAARRGVASCYGDSGGPVLRDDTVLAVVSFGSDPLCRGAAYAFRLDVPAARGFLASFGAR